MPDPISGVIAGGGVISSVVGAKSADKAANAQTKAANQQLRFQQRVHDQQVDRFDPYYQHGLNALDTYNYLIGLGDKPIGYEDISASPSAQFALTQGVDTIEAGAAGRGGLVSGRTAQALEDYRSNIMLSDRDNQLNRIAAMAQQGMGAAGLIGNAGSQLAQGATNAYGAIGNANAARAIGVGNALNSGINSIVQGYQFGNALNAQPQYQPGTLQPGQYAGGGVY